MQCCGFPGCSRKNRWRSICCCNGEWWSTRELLWFSGQGWLVVSLLAPEEEFSAGIEARLHAF